MNGRKLMKSSKRILAAVLAVVMMVSLMPRQEITVVADDTTPYVISLGRATYSSSANGNATSDNAVDGDASTRWESAWGNEKEWFYVDLGKTAQINSIYIKWEGAYATQYDIQVSNDEETWNTVYENLTCNGGEETITLSASARYVRINLNKKALSAYGYSFFEFQVMGTGGLVPRPEDYGENIALNKEVSYSAILSLNVS